MSHQPIVIIGAPRSGTNMLRDVVTRLPGFGTWPCDEINYIWRHGNARFPTDELGPAHATPEVTRFIREAFEALARARRLDRVVEKTCANSLRVDFVERVLPDARYLYIVRDGRDATASAMGRWCAPLDLPYLVRKARFVPWADLPFYGWRYLLNRLHRVAGRELHLATWGPRFDGMEEILRRDGLAAVCAAQWARCVECSDRSFATIDPARVHAVRYEGFVTHPAEELDRIAAFLGLAADPEVLQGAVADVTDRNVAKWKRKLAAEDLGTAEPYLRAQMSRHGYE